MSYGAFVAYDFSSGERRQAAAKRVPPAITYALVIAVSASIGHWMATVRIPAPAAIDRPSIEQPAIAAGRAAPPAMASRPRGSVLMLASRLRDVAAIDQGTATPEHYAALIDPLLSFGLQPAPPASAAGVAEGFVPRIAAPAATSKIAASTLAPPTTVPPLPMVVQLVRNVPARHSVALAEPADAVVPAAADADNPDDATIIPPPVAERSGERPAEVPMPPERPAALRGRPSIAALIPADNASAPIAPRRFAADEPVADAPQRPATLSLSRSRIAALTPADENAAAPVLLPPPRVPSEGIADVPVPTPRPDFLTPPVREAQPRLNSRRHRTVVARATPEEPDRRSFFERLFNMPQPPPRQPAPMLAYASPDNGGGLGLGRPRLGSYDSQTAIYDISAHTVYLPDGTRLEAHSGLGANLDNPSSVRQRMRGVTPPNIYDLGARAELFHGVRAIRLNPTDGRAMFGRDGMLAHTYMLGPRGDSNGCVVFKDYASFLAAFDRGAIKRLAVVSSL